MDLQSSQPWLLHAVYLMFSIGGAVAILTLSARLAIRQSKNDLALMLLAWLCSVTAQSILVALSLRIFPTPWPTRASWAMFAAISAYTVVISGLFVHRIIGPAAFTPPVINGDTAGTLQLPRLYFLFCLPRSSDPARSAAMAIVSLLVEVNLAIICGNLPAMCQATREVIRIAAAALGRRGPASGEDSSSYGSQDHLYPLGGVGSKNSSQQGMVPLGAVAV
ncbi:hypothetical protein LZ30DRAFT_103233 [Colletotrichum cereale]|nr:hypothetical protein LZ30DRAFT_103233 [Colletotrichum cereale]